MLSLTRLFLLYLAVMQIEIADITEGGVAVTPPFALDTNWDIANMVKGFL